MARRKGGAGDQGRQADRLEAPAANSASRSAEALEIEPHLEVARASITADQLMVDAGCTDAEIAESLGLTLAEVSRLPSVAAARIGPAQVARVERAVYEAALAGESWREQPVAGAVVRLAAYRAPDPQAYKTLLSAYVPERYGAAATGIQAAVIINLIGVDRTKHASVARIIEHEGPAGGAVTPLLGPPAE